MSVDTHKFGMASKGTSVVLFSDRDIRQHMFTGITGEGSRVRGRG